MKHFRWTQPITKDDYASTTPQAQWSIPYHIPRHSFLSLSTKKRRISENFKNTRIKSGSRPRSQAKDAKPPVTYNWLPRANTQQSKLHNYRNHFTPSADKQWTTTKIQVEARKKRINKRCDEQTECARLNRWEIFETRKNMEMVRGGSRVSRI